MIKNVFKTIYYLILAVIAVIVAVLVLSVFSVGGNGNLKKLNA